MAFDQIKIIGGHGDRQKYDYYPTPPDCTKALLEWLQLEPCTIWEPAAGEGHIVKVLEDYGHHVIGTDIQTGIDFLTVPLPDRKIDWIITNPPFVKSVDFIEHCAELERPFALLLKSQYWHSVKRKPLFDRIRPSAILPLTWRPDFLGKGASCMDMLWTVWASRDIPTTIYQPLNKPGRA